MKSGILLIDKAKGNTSRAEVNFVSKKLNEKKIGHVGTLDPFADGLLIVLVNKATKVSQYFECLDKEYLAKLTLGKKTDTADLDGNVILEKEIPTLTKEKIKEVFQSFIGEQEQIPPMYSAIKVNGKELYKYARNGEEIERKARKIHIYSLDLISFDNNSITFVARVSKGTYIRTLGEDIAERLNTVGYLSELTRTRVGNLSLDKAHKKEEVNEDNLIDIVSALSFMKKHEVSEEEIKGISNGMHLKLNEKDELVLCVYNGEAIAIYSRMNNGYYKCERGLR